MTLLLLLPSWLALWWLVSKAQWFWSHNPELNFGWLVLLLCAYLFWEAWEKPLPLRLRWSIPNLLCGVAVLVLLFLNQIYQAAFGMSAAALCGLALACLGVVAVNVHYVFGAPGLRQFAFPFAFILVAMPMPSLVQDLIVSTLQSGIASLNVVLLNLLGVPAERSGSLIALSHGTVGIDEACSGVRSLQSSVMATLFIGRLALKRKATQAVLLLGGVLLAVLGNVVRSLYLSYTAHAHGFDTLRNVHDAAGWSILGFTTAGVILLAWALAKAEKIIDASLGPAAAGDASARTERPAPVSGGPTTNS